MARIKIAAKQIILLFSGPRGDAPALQRGVALQDPLLRLARLKLGDIDPRRKAGRARGAGRAIQNILRPPESLFLEAIVQNSRIRPLQRGEKLSLHPVLKIGTGLGRCDVKLRNYGNGMTHDFQLDFF